MKQRLPTWAVLPLVLLAFALTFAALPPLMWAGSLLGPMLRWYGQWVRYWLV